MIETVFVREDILYWIRARCACDNDKRLFPAAVVEEKEREEVSRNR